MSENKNACADPWLEKLDERVKTLYAEQKFGCSHTVLKIGMERLGMENADLMRAMEGFCGGGCSGVCGALAGGCALLGLYLGKGTADEPRSDQCAQMRKQLSEAFRAYWKSSLCDELVHGDPAQKAALCPKLMAGTVEMVWRILQEAGIDIDSRPVDKR